MRRATLAIAVLVALACVANTALAAGGTPASLAANVAAAAVGHRPYAVRVVTPVYPPVLTPVYAPAVVVSPVVVPIRPVLRPPVYVRPLYRPIIGGSVFVGTPYVSVGIGY